MLKIFENKNLAFLKELALTQFKLKDQSTLLGTLWSLLNPIILISVLYIVFSNKFGNKIEHFVIYLLIGVIQYSHFSSATSSAMKSLKSMSNLTKNAVFPKEIIVLSTILATLPEFLISLIVCYVVALVSGVAFSATFILALPIIIILQLSFVFWVSFLMAPLYLVVKDIEHLYQILIRVLFFITPIFYDMSFIENPLAKAIVLANPLTHLITFTREIVINANYEISYQFGAYICLNLVLLVISYLIFKKIEPRFGEVI